MYGISNLPKTGLVSNGRPKVATITRVGGRKQMISWVDAPDDVFFIATEMTRSVDFYPASTYADAASPLSPSFPFLSLSLSRAFT